MSGIIATSNTDGPGWRARLRHLVESAPFQRAVIAVITINAVTLGLETSGTVMEAFGSALMVIDRIVLAIFVIELTLRILAHGPRFFISGWNLFDFSVVAISLLPSSGAFSVLRALRVLRAFRLISAVPAMRGIIEALLKSVPGLSAIIVLLLLIFYVFAVMTTRLFGATNPELFGTLGASFYSLFQVMTLEGWSTEIVNPVLDHHPYALMLFIPFMLLSTFVVLNLFIALIVDSMQRLHKIEIETVDVDKQAAEASDRAQIIRELGALSAEVRELRAMVERTRHVR